MDVPRLHMTDLSDDSGVDALAAALQAAGCVVIEAAASADTMDHIAAELDGAGGA